MTKIYKIITASHMSLLANEINEYLNEVERYNNVKDIEFIGGIVKLDSEYYQALWVNDRTD